MNFFYKLVWWKACIDYGRSLTSYFNELILILGVWKVSKVGTFKFAVILILSYVFFCFCVGWVAYRVGLKEAETEVQNKFNLFVKQMRKKFKEEPLF